jgi:hypothetical protein
MSFHNYTTLNHPMAQIVAAEDFCESIRAFVDDEWEGVEERPAPNVDEVHAHSVLDALAGMGLRFETAGSDDFNGPNAGHDHYFAFKYRGELIDGVLYSLAGKVAERLQEYFTQEDSDESTPIRDVWRLITLNGCSSDLIFVPDPDAVVTTACQLALKAKTSDYMSGNEDD